MAVVGDAYVVVRAITTGFREQVERELEGLRPALDRAGRDLGDGFSNNFNRGSKGMFGNLGREADQARQAFNKLTRTSYLVSPAIAGAVSAISDLIFALGGMIAGIGRATPALAVLGSQMVALIQAGIAAKLAFGGVGKAVSALLKPGDSAKEQEETRKRNKKAIEDAQDAVDKAKQRLGRLKESFDERLLDLERRKTDATMSLSDAYKDAAESLQQLRFQTEGAIYSKDRAAIAFERARETLMRTQDLPPDSRARREAELAFKEAELKYRMATDAASDLGTELAEADAKGLENSDQVLKAKQDLIDVTEDLARLERDHARDLQDSYENIEDAEERLAEARKKAKDDLKDQGKGLDAIADAMKDLSPEAQRFARYIASLKPVLLDLREAAGKNLFLPLERAIQNLVDNLVPVLIPILEKTGGAIGDIAVKFSNMLTTPKNLEIFERVFGGKNVKIIENLGEAFVNVADAMLTILDAVSPIAVEFSKFINEKTASWANNLSKDTKGLSDMFDRSAEAAKRIGTAISGLFSGFKAFGRMSSDMGLDLIDSLGASGRAMADFFSPKTKKAQDEMRDKFAQIGENTKSIGGFFGEVMKLLFELAGNPGVKAFFDTISVIPMMFADSGKAMTGLGSTMGEFFVQIAKVMELFLETGSIEIFFKILTKALKVVETVFSNEIVSQVFVYLAALKAVSLAFGTIGNVFKFFGGATVISPLKKMFEFFGKGGGLSKFLTGLSQGTGTIGKFLNPGGKMNLLSVFGKIGKFAGPLAAVVAVFIEMWQNSEIFRESIQNFLSGVWESLVEAFDTIKLALQDASPAFEGISKNFGKMGEVFGKLGDIIGKYVMPVLQFLVTTIIKGIGQAIAFLIRILAPVIKVMMDMAGVIWDVVKVAFDILIKGVDFIIGAFQILSDFLAPFWDILITGLKVIWELVKVYFGVIFTFWKFVIGKIFEIGKGIWNFIFDKVKIVWDKAKEVLGAIGGFVKGIVEKVGGFLKGIWDFIDIKGKWNTVKGYIENTLIPYVQSIPGKFGAALSGMWDFLSNGLSAAWGAAKRWWNQNVAGKGFSISVPGTDFGVDLKIPKLARGGVVYPGMGGAGTLAMIAEAGRPERVEPLDAQGLSQRDRAIIAEIAGMYGNPRGKDMTINVHPSPGMDERALAYMVNRRIEASRLRGI